MTWKLAIAVGALLVSASAAGAPEPGRPVKVADVDLWGSISRSGRWLAFVDWNTGNLAIRDLASGVDARLTDKGTWMDSGEFGMFPVFSPDEALLAYAWFNTEGFWDLRLASLRRRSEPRVLLADGEHPYIQPHALAPDGRSVLATIQDGPLANRLVLVDVVDGMVRTLADLDWRVPSTACFISGGEAVVFDRLASDEATERGLYRLALEGGEVTLLAEDASSDHILLGCSSDGRHVVFASDRTGSWDVWRVQMAGGGSVGEPERVVPEVGPLVRGLGVTADGSLYYGLERGRAEVYLTAVEPAEQSERLLETVARDVVFNSEVAWSRDGSKLAYVSPRGEVRSGLLYAFDFVVRSMSDSVETRRPLALRTFGGHTLALDWSDDGAFVLAQGRDRSGREGYYRIDVTSGAVEPAVQSEGCPPACLEWPSLAHDGTLYFTRWAAPGQQLVARDLGSGEERRLMPVAAPQAVGPLSVSPDGEWLAALWKDMTSRRLTIRAMAPERRVGRDLAVIEPPLWVTALDWMPDSQHLLYATTDATGRSELWRLPLEFGAPENLGVLAEDLRIYGLKVHPDGERLALTAGTPPRSEVWAVDSAAQQAEF